MNEAKVAISSSALSIVQSMQYQLRSEEVAWKMPEGTRIVIVDVNCV
jgi:hypothetical protein